MTSVSVTATIVPWTSTAGKRQVGYKEHCAEGENKTYSF